MIVIENGLTDDISADPFIRNNLILTGDIFWVDSATGTAAGPGTEEEPYDTLANALAAATSNNGDFIIIKSGHSEILTSSIVVGTGGVKIFGIGAGPNAPTFTLNAVGILGLDIASGTVEINNLRFPAGTTAANLATININASRTTIKNCQFVCGANERKSIRILAGENIIIDSCSFTVTADGPDAGVSIETTGQFLTIKNSSFDGGDIGWDDAAINSAQNADSYVYDTITLTNGAEIIHTNALSAGWITNTIKEDGSSVQLAN